MYTAYITSQWSGTGTEGDAFRPTIADDYALTGWQDVTGHHPPVTPNAYTILATLDGPTLAAIQADASYVVWDVAPVEEVPDVEG